MLLPITLTIAAACAAINLWLALRIVPGRMRGKVLLGDGGSEGLLALQRAHANFTEYAPFVLILLGLIELGGGSPTWLWVVGVAFVLARLAHGLGMTRAAPHPLRGGGALLTWVLLAVLAGWALALAYGAQTTPRAIEMAPLSAQG